MLNSTTENSDTIYSYFLYLGVVGALIVTIVFAYMASTTYDYARYFESIKKAQLALYLAIGLFLFLVVLKTRPAVQTLL